MIQTSTGRSSRAGVWAPMATNRHNPVESSGLRNTLLLIHLSGTKDGFHLRAHTLDLQHSQRSVHNDTPATRSMERQSTARDQCSDLAHHQKRNNKKNEEQWLHIVARNKTCMRMQGCTVGRRRDQTPNSAKALCKIARLRSADLDREREVGRVCCGTFSAPTPSAAAHAALCTLRSADLDRDRDLGRLCCEALSVITLSARWMSTGSLRSFLQSA